MSFFEELKRRNVFRVSIAYVVASWVLLQVVDLVLDNITAPDWVMHVFMLFVGIGFIAAVVIAWAYELTPEGIKREADVDHSQSIVADTGHKLDRIIIGFLAVAVVLLLADRYFFMGSGKGSEPLSQATTESVEEGAEQKKALTPFEPATQTKSIAVLPFVNMSTDIENEFFSDGIAEEILNVLASIPTLKVAARTSAFAYKGTATNISTIAQELGVNHILEGSVRKSGNQVRVTAQLIKADDGFHLWSANYDRELTNIFAIQDEIAGSIAAALKLSLELESGASGNLTGTNSIEAYEHYLQGTSLWHLRTVDALNQAIRQFEAAIQLDPNFAAAHAGLALVWAVYDGYVVIDSKITSKNATQAANKALELDPENVEAMVALASVRRFQFRYDEAIDLFEKAILLNPSFATAYQWYGGLSGEMGDPVAGLAQYQKAWSLDPRSRIIGYNLATRLNSLGRSSEASQVVKEVLDFAPDFPDGLDYMMQLQMFTGECEAAAITAQRLAVALKKRNPAFEVYQDICQSDDPARRRQAVETIMSWPKLDFADPDHPTLTYDYDLITMLIHYGMFEELWKFVAAAGDDAAWMLPQFRIFTTENGIRLQCDPRVDELARKFELPPPVYPVSCD